MSDGDLGADEPTRDHDGDELGFTGTPQGSRGAAPWERFGSTPRAVAVAHRWSAPAAASPPTEPVGPATEDDSAGGSHAEGGLSVADLIAKMGVPSLTDPVTTTRLPSPINRRTTDMTPTRTRPPRTTPTICPNSTTSGPNLPTSSRPRVAHDVSATAAGATGRHACGTSRAG